MKEKIDALILSLEEANILLAIQIIKTFGNPSTSHLNMCLAALSHFKDGKVAINVEAFISEYYDLSIWKKRTNYHTYDADAESSIRVVTKLPFYDYFYFFIWKSIFNSKQRKGLSSVRIKLNELKVLPPEINYLGNLGSLSITVSKEINLAIAFKNISTINVENLSIQSSKLLKLDIHFFTKFNIKSISLTNIHLLNIDNLQGLFPQTISLYWNVAELNQIDLRPFSTLKKLRLKGNFSSEINVGACKMTLINISIEGHPHRRKERPIFFPTFLSSLSQLEYLGIKNQNIKSIPEYVGRLAKLKSIEISNSRLKEFPVHLGNLTELTNLSLEKNLIQEISDINTSFEKLISLNLSRNILTKFPVTLKSLPKLSTLNLGRNLIETFVTSALLFPQLKTLQLNNNKIKKLPEFAEENIQLDYLNINGNQITTLTLSNIIFFRKKIRVNMQNNKVSILPNVKNENLENISGEGGIDAKGNRLSKEVKQEYKAVFKSKFKV